MFEEVAGLPLHPLAVHVAVVLVPLLVLAALGYALVPKIRAHLEWVAVVLAVLGPVSAVVARQSGNAFAQRRGLPIEGALADHQDLGQVTVLTALGLGAVTLALVWFRRRGDSRLRTWAVGMLTVLVVITAAAAGVSVVLSGDSGARMVWEPVWQLVR